MKIFKLIVRVISIIVLIGIIISVIYFSVVYFDTAKYIVTPIPILGSAMLLGFLIWVIIKIILWTRNID